MSDSFCVVPWIQLSTKPNGNIRICCLMTQSQDFDRGVLRRSDGSIYNAREPDFLDSFNTQKAKDLRLDLLAGKKNPMCKACWRKESVGMTSKRQVSNRDFEVHFSEEEARKITAHDGTVKNNPLLYLDLRFGNLCNMKCIMCHPSSSTLWYNDFVELYGEKEFTDTGEKVALESVGGNYQPKDRKYFSWYENESFWEILEERMSQVKQIYLVGGEPLLIKEHERFLERCLQSGIAAEITLEYDTNLSHLNQRILPLWSQFKKVKLRVSIESTGEQNDYIRFPSVWSEIASNISKVRQLNSKIDLNFSITWQSLNIFAVTQVWDHYPETGVVRILNSPAHLDIKVLPKEIKAKALEHLEKYDAKSEIVERQLVSMKEYLHNNMDFENFELLNSFRVYTKNCDRIRGTDVGQVFPELSPIFSEQ